MTQEDEIDGLRIVMSAEQLEAVLAGEPLRMGQQGGHTLREHVGHTEAQLWERLSQEPRLRAASSFLDCDTAELAITAAVHANRRRIAKWAEGYGATRFALEQTTARSTGKVASRKTGTTRDGNKLAVVLCREPYNGMPYFILTAYPIVDHEQNPVSRFMAVARRLLQPGF
ncbi:MULTISPECIES: RNase A-like domain-containing protein [unclassified Cupriavidus]|uniref:RNase A-like domain-containing protein n=1 Tax=unclassified Cupriavidus TaxID=2640874 RepID=UPI001160A174|nr:MULTISPECIES: RNase A-like domain-containing protein [unclassified Cupriavidus]